MMHRMTKNPRLTITLQPRLAAQLRRLSELTGNSQSSLISELLDGSTAVFDRIIQVMEAADAAKLSLKGKTAADLERAQKTMEGQLGFALDVFNDATGSLLDDAEAIKRRARRGAAGDAKAPSRAATGTAPTPLSNRGVRYDPTTTKIIAMSPSPARAKPAKRGVKIRGGEK